MRTLKAPLYVVGIRPVKRLQNARTYGTWEENGTLYVDKIRLFRTERAAMKAAKRHNQLAIFKIKEISKVEQASKEVVMEYTRAHGGATVVDGQLLHCQGEVIYT
jgi:hypothetical protein